MDFHRRQEDSVYPARYAWHSEDVAPVVFVAVHRNDDECDQRHHQCHRDVAGQVGAAGEEGHQPHQVVQEDEEESREQVPAGTSWPLQSIALLATSSRTNRTIGSTRFCKPAGAWPARRV